MLKHAPEERRWKTRRMGKILDVKKVRASICEEEEGVGRDLKRRENVWSERRSKKRRKLEDSSSQFLSLLV